MFVNFRLGSRKGSLSGVTLWRRWIQDIIYRYCMSYVHASLGHCKNRKWSGGNASTDIMRVWNLRFEFHYFPRVFLNWLREPCLCAPCPLRILIAERLQIFSCNGKQQRQYTWILGSNRQHIWSSRWIYLGLGRSGRESSFLSKCRRFISYHVKHFNILASCTIYMIILYVFLFVWDKSKSHKQNSY